MHIRMRQRTKPDADPGCMHPDRQHPSSASADHLPKAIEIRFSCAQEISNRPQLRLLLVSLKLCSCILAHLGSCHRIWKLVASTHDGTVQGNGTLTQQEVVQGEGWRGGGSRESGRPMRFACGSRGSCPTNGVGEKAGGEETSSDSTAQVRKHKYSI